MIMNEPYQKPDQNRPLIYQIKLGVHLDEQWSEWFEDLTVTYDEHDDTLLTGPVFDQSALIGLLIKVHDLSLPLISVNPVGSTST